MERNRTGFDGGTWQGRPTSPVDPWETKDGSRPKDSDSSSSETQNSPVRVDPRFRIKKGKPRGLGISSTRQFHDKGPSSGQWINQAPGSAFTKER